MLREGSAILVSLRAPTSKLIVQFDTAVRNRGLAVGTSNSMPDTVEESGIVSANRRLTRRQRLTQAPGFGACFKGL